MKPRKQPYGSKNIVGARIEERRKELGLKQKDLLVRLQIAGLDLNAAGLSKIEGQIRTVNDFELVIFSEVLGVSVLYLLGIDENE